MSRVRISIILRIILLVVVITLWFRLESHKVRLPPLSVQPLNQERMEEFSIFHLKGQAINASSAEEPKAGQSELKVGSWILNSANLQGAHVVDPYLCKALEEMLFQKKSVLDLGCGIGLYGICFLRLRNHTFPNSERDFFTRHLMGLKDWWKSTGPVIQSWTGYDGTPGIKDLTAGLVKRMDLSKPRYIGRTFNWVLSLEVGEHIPRKYQANYISNLVRHAEEGIVLSWAVEGQGGRSHVNNRNNDIIIAILEGHGFYPQPEIWKSLRGNSSLYWFKNTVMVFTRDENYRMTVDI